MRGIRLCGMSLTALLVSVGAANGLTGQLPDGTAEVLRTVAVPSDIALTRPLLRTDGETLLIVESRNREVWTLGATTGIARRVGSIGQGPGEFMHPLSAGWLADSLWVVDSQQRRIVVYDPEGRPARTAAPPDIELAGLYGAPEALLPDGFQVLRTRRLMYALVQAGGGLDTFLGWIGPTGVLGTQVRLETQAADLVAATSDGSAYHGSQPFTERDRFAVSPRSDGIWIVRRSDAGISAAWLDPTGEQQFEHDVDYASPRLGREDIDTWIERITLGLGESAQRFEEPLRDGLIRPTHWPRFGSVIADYSTAVWIHHPGLPQETWRRICSNGSEYLLALPFPIQDMGVAGDRMFVVRVGEYDVPEILELRLPTNLRTCRPLSETS